MLEYEMNKEKFGSMANLIMLGQMVTVRKADRKIFDELFASLRIQTKRSFSYGYITYSLA